MTQLKKILVTLQENDQEPYTITVYGDVILTKPFGIIIISVDKQKETFISSRLWKTIEFGDYQQNLKGADHKYSIDINGEMTYTVSKLELDGNGVLNLSLNKGKDTIWGKMFAPRAIDYFKSSSLN